MLAPQVEYLDERDAVPCPPVKKQMWDGEKFVPVTLYKIKGHVGVVAHNSLSTTFGPSGIYRVGTYWQHSKSGDFTLMDEKVYFFYRLKWEGR